MAKRKPKQTAEQVPFETSLNQLKAIVRELEEGNLSLSDSLEKYESGMKYLKQCHLALEAAEKKIELLVRVDEDGNLITEPFDDSPTDSRAAKRPTGGAKRYTTKSDSVKALKTDEVDEENHVSDDDDVDVDDSFDDDDDDDTSDSPGLF